MLRSGEEDEMKEESMLFAVSRNNCRYNDLHKRINIFWLFIYLSFFAYFFDTLLVHFEFCSFVCSQVATYFCVKKKDH